MIIQNICQNKKGHFVVKSLLYSTNYGRLSQSQSTLARVETLHNNDQSIQWPTIKTINSHNRA